MAENMEEASDMDIMTKSDDERRDASEQSRALWKLGPK